MSNLRKVLIAITLVVVIVGVIVVAVTIQQQQATRQFISGYLNSSITETPP